MMTTNNSNSPAQILSKNTTPADSRGNTRHVETIVVDKGVVEQHLLTAILTGIAIHHLSKKPGKCILLQVYITTNQRLVLSPGFGYSRFLLAVCQEIFGKK